MEILFFTLHKGEKKIAMKSRTGLVKSDTFNAPKRLIVHFAKFRNGGAN